MKRLICLDADQATMAAWCGGIVIASSLISALLGTNFAVAMVVILALLTTLLAVRDNVRSEETSEERLTQAETRAREAETELTILQSAAAIKQEVENHAYDTYVGIEERRHQARTGGNGSKEVDQPFGAVHDAPTLD